MATTGITPAGAGKTAQPCRRSGAQWDHPRRCGENILRISAFTSGLGSPPQVRGKPIASFILYIEFRITPAGAGKTHF